VSVGKDTIMSTTTDQAAAEVVSIPSQALGAVEVQADRLITATEPLAGFPDCSTYALIEHVRKDGSASPSVFWLQAAERPFQAFVVTDPWGIHPDYAPEISDVDARELQLDNFEDARVFAILTVPSAPSGITVNLRAPIVVNMAKRLAKQVVLLNDEYHTRHLVNGPVG
jgi:flagellar assembly factor FliW